MKKHLHIFVFILILLARGAFAQKAHFEFGKSLMEMQTRVNNGDSTLAFYYVVVYHADSTGQAFDGYISTDFITNKNHTASKSVDSVNVATSVFGGKLNDGDSAKVYGHIRVNSDYFRNGSANIIVVWPTGGRSDGSKVFCMDSATYYKSITVSGLSGLAGAKTESVSLKIYPNPTTSYLNIRISDNLMKPERIKIVDVSGKEVYSSKDEISRIDVSSWKWGTYFLEVDCPDNQKAIYQFIIGK